MVDLLGGYSEIIGFRLGVFQFMYIIRIFRIGVSKLIMNSGGLMAFLSRFAAFVVDSQCFSVERCR